LATVLIADRLKCDRSEPCKNCEKKPPGTCVYRAPQRRKRQSQSSGVGVGDRIQRLERLVTSLAQASAKIGEESNLAAGSEAEADPPAPPLNTPNASRKGQIAGPSPHQQEKEFIDGSHWEAILEDVNAFENLYTCRVLTNVDSWNQR
jgi:hypothetical protein